jgi:hypothetical protein
MRGAYSVNQDLSSKELQRRSTRKEGGGKEEEPGALQQTGVASTSSSLESEDDRDGLCGVKVASLSMICSDMSLLHSFMMDGVMKRTPKGFHLDKKWSDKLQTKK